MNRSILNACVIVPLLAAMCSPEHRTGILSVRGFVPENETGVVLAHEHVMVDFIGADSTGPHRWDRDEVFKRVLPYLEEVSELGCRTFIDCSPDYLGRDPELLRMLSERTGLHILTNTGWYGAMNDKFIPAYAHEMTAEEIAGIWTREYFEGINGTGIRPGFIKIGVDRDDTLSATDEKLIRAAGITHLQTGLVINSHTGPDGPAFAQLGILEKMGIPAEAFIWTHAQNGTHEGRVKAAGMGAWISLDNVRIGNFEDCLEELILLKDEDCLDHVLVSHDAGWYSVGQENGGGFRDYTAVFKSLLPSLGESGFTEEEIRRIMIVNPARAYALSE